MGYIAAGCLGIGKSSGQGWMLPCGIGAGWIQTDLLTMANNHHGLGVYVGPVAINANNKARYGVGVTYVYFLQGVNAKGWNFGVTPATGQENGKAKGQFIDQCRLPILNAQPGSQAGLRKNAQPHTFVRSQGQSCRCTKNYE